MDHRCAGVRIVGEIDSGAHALLESSIGLLCRMAPKLIVIDHGDVTFAGAALPNFLASLHGHLPPSSTVIVSSPYPQVRRLLQRSGLTQTVNIRDRTPHR
jgi:anti-anti-sigma regulatory factor